LKVHAENHFGETACLLSIASRHTVLAKTKDCDS